MKNKEPDSSPTHRRGTRWRLGLGRVLIAVLVAWGAISAVEWGVGLVHRALLFIVVAVALVIATTFRRSS